VVTATALMQLVERGRIGLDTDINRYLEVARVPTQPGPAVTVRHLLTHTDALDVPPDDHGTLATPYERSEDGIRVARQEWYHTTPTSSLVSTVADMARFMALHLGAAPPVAGHPVLASATIKDMAAQHASVHPAIPGWGYGWQQNDANGRRIIEHGGDIGGFASLMTLMPDEQFGIIVVHHLEGSNLRFALKTAILDRFYPDRRPRAQPRPRTRGLRAYAGTYLANNYCRSCRGGAENAQRFTVTLNSDGSLGLWDDRWREIGPLLFASEDGRRKIGFMQDSTGTVVAVSAGAWRVLERAPRSLVGACASERR
jgi:CubicO group peptidase (beta-lactamase class C family)